MKLVPCSGRNKMKKVNLNSLFLCMNIFSMSAETVPNPVELNIIICFDCFLLDLLFKSEILPQCWPGLPDWSGKIAFQEPFNISTAYGSLNSLIWSSVRQCKASIDGNIQSQFSNTVMCSQVVTCK